MITHQNSFIPFKEVQKFPRSWRTWVATGIFLAPIVILWFPLPWLLTLHQYGGHYDYGHRLLLGEKLYFSPAPFVLLGAVTIILLTMGISILYGKITTEVNQGGLYIYFPFCLPLFPFRKKIPLQGLVLIKIGEGVYRINRSPLLRHSGMGVHLKFPESSMLRNFFIPSKDDFIMSRRPEELAQAIQQLVPNCKVVQVRSQ